MIGQTNGGTDISLVKKSGDTMTGVLRNEAGYISDTNIDKDTTPSSNKFFASYIIRAVNNQEIGALFGVQSTAGSVGTQLETAASFNGTRYTNNVRLWVNKDGTKSVTLSDPAAWRSALGLGNIQAIHLVAGAGTTNYRVTLTNTYAPILLYGIEGSRRIVALVQGGNNTVDKVFVSSTNPTATPKASGWNSSALTFDLQVTGGLDAIAIGYFSAWARV